METKHTPTLGEQTQALARRVAETMQNYGEAICFTEVTKDILTPYVRACHAHNELVAALDDILQNCFLEKAHSANSRNINEYRAAAKLALAKARGEA